MRSFTDERRFRPDLVALLEKVSVVYDKSVPQDTRKMQVTVEVTLDDGTRYGSICHKPPGTWGERIDEGQHRAKMRDCLGVRLDAARADRVLEMLERLEQLSVGQIRELAALLA